MFRKPVFIIVILLLLFGCQRQSPAPSTVTTTTDNPNIFKGECVGVSDGDTIKVLRDGKEVKIRLFGIDCPEKTQAFGQRAKQFTSSLIFGKQVTVDIKDTDRYGRLVCKISIDSTDVNQAIVDAGFAWAYTQYSKEYVENERRAREAKRGLWSDKNPTPPWNYRKNARNNSGNENAMTMSNTSGPDTGTVYITKSGKKYHREDCKTLKSTPIAVSRTEAESRGLKPCGYCKP